MERRTLTACPGGGFLPSATISAPAVLWLADGFSSLAGGSPSSSRNSKGRLSFVDTSNTILVMFSLPHWSTSSYRT